MLHPDEVVAVLGLSQRLEGEEMKVEAEGFSGGDRTSLDLPLEQRELLKAVAASGKPVVLLLMAGSALSVNWAQENVAAILYAGYPGEQGGNAIADVLMGDYNPAGRLTLTYYGQFSMINKKGQRVIEAGEFTLWVGGKQPGGTAHRDTPTTGITSGRLKITGRGSLVVNIP